MSNCAHCYSSKNRSLCQESLDDYDDLRENYVNLHRDAVRLVSISNSRKDKLHEMAAKERKLRTKYNNLRQKVIKSKLVLSNVDEGEETTDIAEIQCPICLENKKKVVLGCGHCLCGSCYNKVADNNCPICRTKIVSSTRIYL